LLLKAYKTNHYTIIISMEQKTSFFLKEKPSKSLIKIYRNPNLTASDLRKKIDTTYAHQIKILQELEEQNIITREKKGRSKKIKLTDKGLMKAEKMHDIYTALENI